MRPCDHPVDIAILRAVMSEPDVAFTQAALAQAVEWLGDTKLATTKNLRVHLAKLVERGLLRRHDSEGMRWWQLNRAASVQQATGGIDPLTTTPEAALTAFSWRSGRTPVEFDPQAHKRVPEGTDRIEKAMRQVTSPWQYAERLRRI